VAVLAALMVAPPAQADRNFEVAFSTNDAGDVRMAANAVLSCQGDQPGCPQARAATPGAKLGNNSWAMRYVDVDSDSNTFNSSNAALDLPAGARVLFARLYWGANTDRSARGAEALDTSARGRVLLRTPAGGGYQQVQADLVDRGSARSQAGAYQAYADVQGQVQAGGAGTYTVANVQSGTGDDRYGGWALVVAYAAPGEAPRNLTVFDGFVSINSGDAPREISVSGFQTPLFGPVRSQLGFVAYEGDLSLGGDSAALNGRDLSDAANPANNFFNSAVSRGGVNVTSRDPAYPNNLGYDAIVADLTGRLANNARSAAIRLKTTGDTYIPGVVFLATELYAPDLASTKSVADLNGGLVEPGDLLEYTIGGTNGGQDAAASVMVTDQVPAGTDFVPGSLTQTVGAGSGARSDGADGDSAEFSSAAGQVAFRVGAGATGTAGGRIAPGESYQVRYRVRVAAGTATGTPIVNRAGVSLLAETLGFPINGQTNDTRLTVSSPDLAISKAFSGTVLPGQVVTYTMTVANVGEAPSRGEVVVADPMPATISFGPPGGAGWACAQTPAFEVRCTRSDSLAPGASYPPITISGTILSVPPDGLINTSTVSGGGDSDQSNNTSSTAPPGVPFTTLALDKQVTPDTAVPGERVTYLLTVSNRGGFGPATGVQLSDPLPAGLTLQSAEALDQGSCTGAVTCSLGTLPIGGTARVRVVATVNAGATPGARVNTATVSANEPDLEPGDNTAAATVKVNAAATVPISIRPSRTPLSGGPGGWTATLANSGPATVPGGAANIVVPPALVNPSGSVPGGSCTTAGRLVSCRLPSIPPGGQSQVNINGSLPPGSGGDPLRLGAQIFTRTYVPPPFPSASTRPTAVALPAADVGVAKVGTPAPAARRGLLTYRLRATNHGPSNATNVVVRDRLPAGTKFVRASRGRTCKASNGVVRCTIRRIRNGRSVELNLVTRLAAKASAREVTNRVRITAEQSDPAAANNRDRTGSALAPRLLLSKTAGAARAGVGDTVTYRLELTNRGPGSARNLTLCDRPGAGLTVRRAPGSTKRGKARCWRIARLARGRSTTRRVVASVARGAAASRTNRATVRVARTAVASDRAKVAVRRTVGVCPSAFGPVAGPAC
jgi:uncharacterized repeat protein (TIGR01451 family)